MGTSPRERVEENATEIAGTIVTGLWLVALFAGWEWWLPLMLFGYLIVLPLVSILTGEDDERDDRWADWNWGWGSERESEEGSDRGERPADDRPAGGADDALATLRDRYARGELTDEQFERKLDRLLDSETVEDVEDRRRRERAADPEGEPEPERERR